MKAKKDRKKKLALLLLLLCISTGGYHAATRRNKASAELYLMQGTLGPSDTPGYTVAFNDATPRKAHRISRVAETSEQVSTPSSNKSAKIDIGLDVSHAYVLPVLRLHVALGGGFVLGAYASYVKNLSSIQANAYGGGITGEYYFGGRAFQGWLVDASIGAYHIDGQNPFRASKANPIAISSTIGWSGQLLDLLAIQLAIGGQYAFNGSNNIGDIKFNGILPLAKVGLGFAF